MTRTLLTIALLLSSLPVVTGVRLTRVGVGDAGQLTLRLEWDPPNTDPDGYRIGFGIRTGIYDQVFNVGPSTTATVQLPAGSDTTRYYLAVAAYSAALGTSEYSNEVATLDDAQSDPCAAPLGNRSVAIFITRWEPTTSNPGSQARINFQLGSPNSPIIRIQARLNGQLVGEPIAGTRSGGIWFDTPLTPGLYVVTLEAANAAGCSALATRDGAGRVMTVVVVQ